MLEISIGGGAFQDILAAGGSFVTGGYNVTISTCCSNPIAGRPSVSTEPLVHHAEQGRQPQHEEHAVGVNAIDDACDESVWRGRHRTLV